MSVLGALALLCLLQWVGETLVRLLALPLPGALVGLLLLLAGLLWQGRVPAGLQRLTELGMPHLLLLFIAPTAGVVQHLDLLAHAWLPFVLACVGGAALTLVVTGWTLQWALRRFPPGEPRS